MSDKKRSENWATDDKMLLMELVRERVKVIENKNTDTNTNSRKVAAWQDLLTSFNAMRTGPTRTIAQLKNQWGSLKLAEKRKLSEEKKLRLKTGGGPPPPDNPTDSNDITAWLPQEFVVHDNEFDSDTIYQVPESLPLPEAEPTTATCLTPPIQLQNFEVENIEAAPEPEPEGVAPPSAQKGRASPKGRKKRKIIEKSGQPAADIAANEIKCREELHRQQMENERKKSRILDLKEQLILSKIEFYKRRCGDNNK